MAGRPPRKRLLRVHAVLGMPGIQRLGLAPTAAGWALWTDGRWSRLKHEQREATTRGGHRNGRSRVLSPPPGAPKSHRPTGHQCGGRTPWGTKRESGLPKAALQAWPAALRRARPRAPPSNLELSPALKQCAGRPTPANDSYLVDSASSHMLVSKIKPCMSKYKQLYSETANGSLYKLSFI